jgi:hypothetical protein
VDDEADELHEREGLRIEWQRIQLSVSDRLDVVGISPDDFFQSIEPDEFLRHHLACNNRAITYNYNPPLVFQTPKKEIRLPYQDSSSESSEDSEEESSEEDSEEEILQKNPNLSLYSMYAGVS